MQADAFLDALHGAFDDFPRDELPRDPFYARVLDEVGGLAKPNNLALIAAATTALGNGESYVEAGSFKGASLIAASHGKRGEFVGIDDFSLGEGNRELLDRNLAAFGSTHAQVVEGDVFAVLGDGTLEGRVGVYYYDAGHEREEQLAGLRLVEPYLADEALLIVDDTDWEHVAEAVDEYVTSQPQAEELLRVEGKSHGAPHWWEGMRVLHWRRA